MANEEQAKLLKHSVAEWNEWRHEPVNLGGDVDLREVDLRKVDLRGAELGGGDLREANLRKADLRGADLQKAILGGADLRNADLRKADLRGAILISAKLNKADLRQAELCNANLYGAFLISAKLNKADLDGADLRHADLREAKFREADLKCASLISANIKQADLRGCHVYGASVWDIKTNADTKQTGLNISKPLDPMVFVDDLEVAQFIYLLLNHKKLRNVLNATTKKGVLILGRFRDGGLEVLQAVAARIREMEYLPMLFDFEPTDSRDLTETVQTMVGLARFVIADLSGPSVLGELKDTVKNFEVPFIPIIEEGRESPSMTSDLDKYPWFRWPPVIFANKELLIEMLPEKVIDPAEEIAREREERRAKLFPEAK